MSGAPLVGATEGEAVRIVSYNLREHAAVGELRALTEDNDVDVLCLQECRTAEMPERIGHMVKVGATENNRLGLAMYCREDRYDVKATRLVAVHKSLHDRVLAPAHERLLAAHLVDRTTGQEVLVGDFHAAPLTASNALRRKQISAAHDGMRSLADNLPALMVGDFNYPWFIRALERHLDTSGYTLTRTTQPTYLRYKFFTGYFDFVTSTGFSIERVDVLPAGASDHRAISLKANISVPTPR